MSNYTEQTPAWVVNILQWKMTAILARVVLTCAYWIGGLNKAFHFQDAIAEQAHFGLQPAALFAVATIAVELIGSLMVISGRWVWLGAGALGVFTLMANLVANAFWNMDGQARFMAMNAFLEHLGLIAGFVIVSILTLRQSSSKTAI
jgi:uncharacterized membrane protein YphA (DoxX/SURF4 family)